MMGLFWSDGLLSWLGMLGWDLVVTAAAPRRLHLAPGLSQLPYMLMISQPLRLAALARAELSL